MGVVCLLKICDTKFEDAIFNCGRNIVAYEVRTVVSSAEVVRIQALIFKNLARRMLGPFIIK